MIWDDTPFNGWSIYHQSASFLPQFPASENFECLSGGKTFWMRKNSWAKKNFRLYSRWLSGIFDHKVFHKLIDVTCWGLVNHAMNKTVVHRVCQGLCLKENWIHFFSIKWKHWVLPKTCSMKTEFSQINNMKYCKDNLFQIDKP